MYKRQGVEFPNQDKVYPNRRGGGTPFFRNAELNQLGVPVIVGIYGTNPAGGGYHSISPTILIAHSQANMAVGGAGILSGMNPKGYIDEESAEQIIAAPVSYTHLHPDVLKTCQLSMGMTALEPGSVWNSMPCHTHERRMEIYMYFEVPENQVVMHFMGEPTETRHIVMKNEEAVISPSWSIHCGAGTSNYTFIWAMGGENQEFDDMDTITPTDLK